MANQNQIDYNHATDAQYKNLRAQAQEAMDKYHSLSQKSQNAYKQGDKVEAKNLSEQSKKFMIQGQKYNEEAANYVFQQNNLDSSQEELDLHGLFVDEAEWIMKRRIYMAVQNREPIIKVIVGKGLHSANHTAKLKPAMESICSQYNLNHYLQSGNSGVMCIDLNNVQLNNLPTEWATMDYSRYLSLKKGKGGNVTKPQTNQYASQNAPQYQQQQQQGYYGNQQQQGYYTNQQPQYQQQQNSSSQNNDCGSIVQIIKMVISCLK